MADLDANGSADVFLYNRTTGQWSQAIHRGGGDFVYYSSVWSPEWQVSITDFNADGRSDLLLYNGSTGVWFQCLNASLGAFSYTRGAWKPGLAVVPASTRVP